MKKEIRDSHFCGGLYTKVSTKVSSFQLRITSNIRTLLFWCYMSFGWVIPCSIFSWKCSFVLGLGNFIWFTKPCAFHCIISAWMAFVFLEGSQSVVKDTTGCYAKGNILCLEGTVANLSQSTKFITHKQADNEMKIIQLKSQTRCFHAMFSVWFT